MHRAFIYGPQTRGMTHAGQFEPSPRTPPPPYPAAPYANLRTPGGSGHFPPRAAFLIVTVAIKNHTCLPDSNHSGRVRIVILGGVFAPLPLPLGVSLSTLRAIRNLTQLPENNRDHQILIDTSFGVLAAAPGQRQRRHPAPGEPTRFAPPVLSRWKPRPTNRTDVQRPGSRGRTIPKKHSVRPMIASMPRESHPVPMPFGFSAPKNCHRRTRRADAVVALPRHSCAAAHYRRVARIAFAPDAVRARFCPRARRAPAPISNPLPAIRKQRKPLKTIPK
jgi:hypothetical protein